MLNKFLKLALLLTLIVIAFSTPTYASHHTNCGQSEGRQAICVTPGGGSYDVNAGDNCASEDDSCNQRDLSPEEQENPDQSADTCFVCDSTGQADGNGRWRESGGVCADPAPECKYNDNSDNNFDGCKGGDAVLDEVCSLADTCGDSYCSESELTSQSCSLDCGEVIAGAGGACTVLESGEIDVDNVPRSSTGIDIQPTDRKISTIDNGVWKNITDGFTNLWRNMRAPWDRDKASESVFVPKPTKVLIEGVPEENIQGFNPSGNKRIGYGQEYLGLYNDLSNSSKGFLNPPNVQSIVDDANKVDTTDAPKNDVSSEGNIIVPWGDRLRQLISNAFSTITGAIQSIFNKAGTGTVQNVKTKINTCTPYGRSNVQNTRETFSLFRMPNMGQDKPIYQNKRVDDSIDSSFEVRTGSGSTVQQKNVSIKTYGTGEIRDAYLEARRTLTFDPTQNVSFTGSYLTGALPTTIINTGTGRITETPTITGHNLTPNLSKINSLIPLYQMAGQRYNIPWQMLAAIHFREGNNEASSGVYNGGGICVVDTDRNLSGRGTYVNCRNGKTLENDALDAALHLKGKMESLINDGRISQPLAFNGDNSTESIKWVMYAYNGMRDPNSYLNSPYLMNNWFRSGIRIVGTLPNGTHIDQPDTKDGAWKVFVTIVNANYAEDGTIVSFN